jgi:hypothetical protein
MIYAGSCYEILTNLRMAINEYSAALVQGTDTTGAFQNSYLITQINKAQNYIHGILFSQMPDLFLTNTTLAFSSSVATLPSDCFKVREILDVDGFPLTRIDMGQRHVASYTGDKYAYYRYGNTIRVDQDSVTETGTIWYYTRPREITAGASSAGGALSLTLATTAKKVADYYNNMTIENVTDDWTDTISDYSATRICTLAAQTGAASKYYGVVSELPETFHRLIEERAIIQVKQHPKAPFKITQEDLQIFNENFRSIMMGYAGTNTGEVNLDDMINDFDSVQY